MLPDLKLPIEDENAAEFWLEEFRNRYNATSDAAFRESAGIVQEYIDLHFPDEDDWA